MQGVWKRWFGLMLAAAAGGHGRRKVLGKDMLRPAGSLVRQVPSMIA
jgi:hypothetical protein